MPENFLSTPLAPDLADLDSEKASALLAAAYAGDFSVFELDGTFMTEKEKLMKHAASVLCFPGDFGKNWDALIDYLGDMASFHKNKKILIVIKSAAEMEKTSPELYASFRKNCSLACENARQWSGSSVTLKFIFVI